MSPKRKRRGPTNEAANNLADYTNAAKLLKRARRVILGGHPQMDGDALGSLLALRASLTAAGRECLCVTQDGGAGKYSFLDGADLLTPLNEADLNGYDTCIMVDCGAESRARAILQRLAPGTKVLNLDHHVDNPGFGDAAVVLPRSSSSGEVVYNTLHKAGIPLNKAAAEAVFVAIITDTGRFMFNNSTPESLRIVARLIEEFGVDVAGLTAHIYRNKTPQRLKLEALVTNTLKLHLDGKVSVATVTRAMLDETGCDEAESTEMVTIPKSLHGAMVSILLRETGPRELRVSWRSEGQIAVNEIAAQFKGGGHLRAAGAHIKDRPVEEVEREIVDATVKALGETLQRTGGAIIV